MSSTFLLNLTGVNNATTLLSNGQITVDGGTAKTITAFGGTVTGTVLTIPGYGTFDFTTGLTTGVLKLSSSAPAATYSITGDTTALVTSIDASAMTNAFTLGTLNANEKTAVVSVTTGAGADVVDTTGATKLATVSTGAGKDTITVGSDGVKTVDAGEGDDTVTLNAATTNMTVALGAGKDSLVLTAAGIGAGTAEVTDYNYAEGDTITAEGATFALSAGGKGTFITKDTGVVIDVASATDSVFRAKVGDTDYWTAASTATSVTMDASSLTGASVLDASGTKNATVVSGLGIDTITKAAKSTMITLGKATGADVLNGGLDSTTTVNLAGATLSDVKVSTDASTLVYGASKLDGLSKTAEGSFKLSFDNGATSGNVQYNVKDGGSITAATDTTYFLGVADNTVLKTTAAMDVNLQDATKFSGITKVTADAGSKGTFVGNSGVTASTTIDGSNATDSLVIWGGSKAEDSIHAGVVGDAADTIWFGTNDGNDNINGFDSGFGSNADVLNLYDVSAVTGSTFVATGGKTLTVKASSTSKANVTVATDNDHLKVKLSDGTVKNVAVSTNNADDTVNGVGADLVIGIANKTDNTVVYDDTQTATAFINLLDTTKYLNDIVNVTATDATGDLVVIGAKDKQSALKLGTGTNNAWGGSTDANTFTLSTGTDTIWYGATDGNDTIETLTAAKDVIRFYEATSAADIASTYTFARSADNVMTATAASTAAVLTVKGTAAQTGTTYNFNYGSTDTTVVKANLGTGDLAFATDTQIYGGGATEVSAAAAVTGTVFADLANTGSLGNYYFDSKVTTFDGSASAASFVLIGRAGEKDTLKGGLTNNNMWGGGFGSQSMEGNTAAVDTIWFGTTDGADEASKLSKNDVIYLYDVSDIANVKMTVGTDGTETIGLTNASLKITDDSNTALQDGLTFKLSTGATYTYNKTNKVFVAK